jgi:malate dehydrogenase (oxaloacetate-decarboxylating)
VATATLLDPVPYNGVIYEIGQANNFLAFPGLGLGVIVAGARRVTKAMMQADAKAIAAQTDPTTMGAALPPNGENLRAFSAVVTQAVYGAAHAATVAPGHPTTWCMPSPTPCGSPNTSGDTNNDNN